jgi:hypothetical protein
MKWPCIGPFEKECSRPGASAHGCMRSSRARSASMCSITRGRVALRTSTFTRSSKAVPPQRTTNATPHYLTHKQKKPRKRQPAGQNIEYLMKILTSTDEVGKSNEAIPRFRTFSRGLRTRDEKAKRSSFTYTDRLQVALIPTVYVCRSGSISCLHVGYSGIATIYIHRLDRNSGANRRPHCFSHYHRQFHIAATLRFASRFCASVPGAERDAVKLSQSLSRYDSTQHTCTSGKAVA